MNITPFKARDEQTPCRHCREQTASVATVCSLCRQPLDWVAKFPKFRDAIVAAVTTKAPAAGKPPEIEGDLANWLPLEAGRETTIGLLTTNTLPVHDRCVAVTHCVLAPQPLPDGELWWIVDYSAAAKGTFLNGHRIAFAPLSAGDFIQIGRFAWVYSEEQSALNPVGRIRGVGVELRDVKVVHHPRRHGIVRRLVLRLWGILLGCIVSLGNWFYLRPNRTVTETHEHPTTAKQVSWLSELRESCRRASERLVPRSSTRAGPFDLDLVAGEFVAVRGASGSGKSTLVKVLAGLPGLRDSGQIQVIEDGQPWDIDDDRGRYRTLLGYVSQDSIVHPQLQPRQALEFSARLRGGPATDSAIEAALRKAEIPRESWTRRIVSLSGGQDKRVRTAAELITRPRLLLLDEPDSGLDGPRQVSLMRHLRSLSFQGCTIVIVTHGAEDLAEKYCDRVLRVEGGRIADDCRPLDSQDPTDTNFNGKNAQGIRIDNTASGTLNLAVANVPANGNLTGIEMNATTRRARNSRFPLNSPHGWNQWLVLIERELQLFKAQWISRLLVPLVCVPAFFAVAISLAVRRQDLHLQGFLSIISCLWMGASLGLLAIAGEREVFDHERNLFLRIPCYLAAKFTTLGVISTLQCVIFYFLLWLIRSRWLKAEVLFGWETVVPTLCLVGQVGLGLGLIISAIANRQMQLANFLLPLAIILQIVFNVQVMRGSQGNDSLHVAYADLHFYNCAAAPACRQKAARWIASPRIWLCERCSRTLQSNPELAGVSKNELLNQLRAKKAANGHDKLPEDPAGPAFIAVAATYSTFSRYADIALRSYAYHERDYECLQSGEKDCDATLYGYAVWRCEAIAALFASLAGMLIATGGLLWWQTIDRNIWPLSAVRRHRRAR